MKILVALFGVLIVAMTAFGAARPKHLLAILVGLPTHTRLRVAVGVRIVMGVVFIVAAPSCRFPWVIYAVGVLTLVAGIVLIPIGATRLERIIQRISQQPAWLVRLCCAGGIAFGAFIVYSGV